MQKRQGIHFDEFITEMASVDVENDFHSPRVSFSVYLSPTDIIPGEKQDREEDLKSFNSNTDFEFSLVSNVDGSENLILADKLAVEGSIRPQIRLKDVNFADHYTSEVRNAAAPDSNPEGTGNDATKVSSRQSGKWREIFNLCNIDYFCAASKAVAEGFEDTKEMNKNDVIARSSFSWLFTRSRSDRSGSLSSLPFSRSKSAGECKSKLESDLWRRSKSLGANASCEDFKSAQKAENLQRERSSKKQGGSKSLGDIYAEVYVASYRDVYGRSRVGNVESCSAQSRRAEASAINVAIGGNYCFCAKFCSKGKPLVIDN